MSGENTLELVRTQALELVEVDAVANIPAASVDGNQRLALVGGTLYAKDFDGVVGPAIKSLPVADAATMSLTPAEQGGRTVILDTVAGVVATLPAATGTGNKYRFVIKVLATSNSYIVKVANATDVLIGIILALTDGSNAVIAWAAGATDDTVTLNRSTTGGVSLGEFVEFHDIALNTWAVSGVISQSGSEATPFSATVS